MFKLESAYYCLLILSCSFSGCSSMAQNTLSRVQEADARKLVACQFLGQVYGESYRYFTGPGLEMVKEHARVQASEIGASHVTWLQVQTGFPSLAIARAYRCDPVF